MAQIEEICKELKDSNKELEHDQKTLKESNEGLEGLCKELKDSNKDLERRLRDHDEQARLRALIEMDSRCNNIRKSLLAFPGGRFKSTNGPCERYAYEMAYERCTPMRDARL